MNRLTPHQLDDRVEQRGRANAMSTPSGDSVWDIAPAPAPPVRSPVELHEPSEPTIETRPEPIRSGAHARPTAPETPIESRPWPTLSARSDEPLPEGLQTASQPALVTKGIAGLISVAVLGLAIVIGAGWFLGGDADGAADDSQSAPTLPAAASALSVFTDVSSLPGAGTDAEDAAVEATIAPARTPAGADSGSQVEADDEPSADSQVLGADDAVSADEPVLDEVPADEPVLDEVPADEPVLDEVPVVALDSEPESVDDAAEAAAPIEVSAPRVEIVSRVESCRFGSSCLVAGFTLHGFDQAPAEFVCEFASGSRFAFRASASTVDHACATGTVGDTITIEVDGVRSETVTHR